MRWGVGIGLSAVLSLGLAGDASSGALANPFEEQVCADLAVTESMDLPDTAFSGAGSSQLCQKLCNKAVRQCRGYAKDSASCLRRWVQGLHGYSVENCDVIHAEDPGQRKECKQNAKATLDAQRGFIQGFLAQSLDECEDWGTICAENCAPL